MKKYIELTLIPNPEVTLYFLWSKLYIQLHLAFVEIQDSSKQVPVGVSFPEYKEKDHKNKKIILLGSKIRLFAQDEETLVRPNLSKWLERLTDYVHIKSISAVPEKIAGHIVVSRHHFPATSERLARRYASRHKDEVGSDEAGYQKALERLKGYEREVPAYPYIQLKSLSGENKPFNLFISQRVVDAEKTGFFSTYGLSAEVTVPFW